MLKLFIFQVFIIGFLGSQLANFTLTTHKDPTSATFSKSRLPTKLNNHASGSFQTQSDLDWSPPQKLFQTDGVVSKSSMALVADGFGNLHLFFPYTSQEGLPTQMNYSYWDGRSWSFPIDIIVDLEGAGVHHFAAAIDSQQTIHLTWVGYGNNLFFASAPAQDAGNPQSWSSPISIGNSIAEAGVAVGSDDIIYVAFAESTDQGSVFLTISRDGGISWSNPREIYPGRTGVAPARVTIAIDDTERIHVAWTEHTLPTGEPFTGVYYSRSLDSGETWENPKLIDGERHGEIGVGTVGENEIHLVWRSNIGGDGTFHQWSEDGGKSWSAPDIYDDSGGQSGLPSFAVDNTDRLHYIIGPVYYSMWSNGQSSGYRDVATEEVRSTASLSDGEQARLAISTGNQVHVVFETGFEAIWHTQLDLNVPPVPTVSPEEIHEDIPIAEQSPPSSTAEDNLTHEAIQTTRGYSWTDDPPGEDSSLSTLGWSIFITGVLVALMVLIVLLWRNSR